jgi:hypothetical protein
MGHSRQNHIWLKQMNHPKERNCTGTHSGSTESVYVDPRRERFRSGIRLCDETEVKFKLTGREVARKVGGDALCPATTEMWNQEENLEPTHHELFHRKMSIGQ